MPRLVHYAGHTFLMFSLLSLPARVACRYVESRALRTAYLFKVFPALAPGALGLSLCRVSCTMHGIPFYGIPCSRSRSTWLVAMPRLVHYARHTFIRFLLLSLLGLPGYADVRTFLPCLGYLVPVQPEWKTSGFARPDFVKLGQAFPA